MGTKHIITQNFLDYTDIHNKSMKGKRLGALKMKRVKEKSIRYFMCGFDGYYPCVKVIYNKTKLPRKQDTYNMGSFKKFVKELTE